MSAPLALLIAYAAGCLPFATGIARLHGVDLREHGSGNPGATNAGRVLGKPWGLLVLVLDMAKGALPVALLSAPAAELGLGSAPTWLIDVDGRTLLTAAAVLGHVMPVTNGFRGGKGVATLIGAALALQPAVGAAGVVAHLLTKKVLGFVAAASVVLAWGVAVARAALAEGAAGTGVLILLALLVTLRHRDNFRRMRAGTEDRYDEDPDAAQEGSSPREPAGKDA